MLAGAVVTRPKKSGLARASISGKRDRWAHVGLLRDVPFEDLAENNHGLADEAAQLVVADRIEVLFRIHQIDKKVHAPLVQPHPSAFPGCSVPNAELVNEYGTRKFRAILPQSMRPGFGRAVDARLTTAGYFFGVLHNLR